MSRSENSHLPEKTFMEALAGVERPLCVTHVTPDADAIGSALGMASALRERGLAASCGLPEGCVSKKLMFMLELAPQTPIAPAWSDGGEFDALIVLDAASKKRVNIEPLPDFGGELPVFNIDHHITNDDYARYNWVDPHASSTSELVSRLIGAQGWGLSPSVASLLYAGIHGDTAGFSLASTRSQTLEAAATLLRAGADVAHIGEQLCRSQTRHDFELLRRVYDHTALSEDGSIAYSFLTHDDFVASGARAEDVDDQVSIPLALKGVRMAMLFSEGEKGVVRINLRGEGRTTVLDLAKQFGGGGHSHAAGVRVRNRPIEAVIGEVLAAAREYLRSH